MSSDNPQKGKLYPDAEKNGCPCGEASRMNCAACQDLPVWYFDNDTPPTIIVERDK